MKLTPPKDSKRNARVRFLLPFLVIVTGSQLVPFVSPELLDGLVTTLLACIGAE